MKIYLATSWKNAHYNWTLQQLRLLGLEVYDFRDEGFSWSHIDPNWPTWGASKYLAALDTDIAERGFGRDMEALAACDACIAIMPFGVSAALEIGYATGAQKHTAIFIPELRDADLMVKMVDCVSADFNIIIEWLETLANDPRL